MSTADRHPWIPGDSPGQRVARAVTALFVPGDRPDRFAKAADSGADLVIIDLEDAVAGSMKTAALQAVLAALTAGAAGRIQALVRMNAIGTATFDDERRALAALTTESGHGLLGVMIPKAENPAAIAELAEGLGRHTDRDGPEMAVVALVESALGVFNAPLLAQVPGLTRLAFGAIDFALDINADSTGVSVDHARVAVVIASRLGGLAGPLDSPSTDIGDQTAVSASAAAARRIGFTGKLCIHPSQLAGVRTGFAPTDPEIAWARTVVGAGDAAVQVAGHMIDRPVIERARQILSLLGETTP
jgi:citrate lyase subunit beta / citryl-CoA lyase